jgi:DNA-binding MarR family transcriptional regulator
MGLPDAGNPSTSTPTVEVAFSLTDAKYPFTGCALETETAYELTDIVPRAGDRCAEFFYVTGASPERVATAVGEFDGIDPMILAEYDDGALFEFLVSRDCPALELAERGALPRTVRGGDGTGRIVAEIPAYHEPQAVIESFLADYPAAELTAKRRKDAISPRTARSAFERIPAEALTDRQWEVLETAYEHGYYDWPRECTGEEVATELGIASATFSEHIQAAERKLLSLVFAEETAPFGEASEDAGPE